MNRDNRAQTGRRVLNKLNSLMLIKFGVIKHAHRAAPREKGITAFQMDTKIAGIERAVMERALEQARQGRLVILEEMKK